MPWSCGALHDPFRDRVADVGVLGDAGLVVGDGHDRRAVPADQGQDALEPLLLPGDRVDERLALVHGEARLQRLHDRRVDGERQVGQALDQPDGMGQHGRLVGQRDAGVDVEHVGPGRHLGDHVTLDAAEVAGLHLLGQQLAAGGVDPLADDHERLVVADDDLAGGRADDRARHAASPRRPGLVDAAGGHQAGQDLARVGVLEACGLGLGGRVRLVGAGRLRLAPLGDVVVHGLAGRPSRRPCRWPPGTAGGARSWPSGGRRGRRPGRGCRATR